MIDWTRSYSCEWRVFRVDPDTWADGARLEGVDSLEVQSDATGDVPLLDAGGMTVSGDVPPQGYYRIALTARQDGAIERADVATLLFEATGYEVGRGTASVELTGRSTLWPAQARLLTGGEYAPAGTDGAAWAAALLRSCCHAPVEVADGAGFALRDPVWGEAGASVLSHVWDVVRAGGRTLRVMGDGTIVVAPLPTAPALDLGGDFAAIIDPTARVALDVSEVPNRVTAIDGAQVAVATNEDAESPVSHQSRGYWYDVVETSPTPAEGETLGAYAARRLRELSVVSDEREWVRGYVPGVRVGDLVRVAMGGALDGTYRIRTMGYDLGRGVTVTERASREVQLWA